MGHFEDVIGTTFFCNKGLSCVIPVVLMPWTFVARVMLLSFPCLGGAFATDVPSSSSLFLFLLFLSDFLGFWFVFSSSASTSTISLASVTLGFFSGHITLDKTTVVVFSFTLWLDDEFLLGGRADFYFDDDVDIFDRAFVVVLVEQIDGGAASVGLFIMVGMIMRGGDVVLLCY